MSWGPSINSRLIQGVVLPELAQHALRDTWIDVFLLLIVNAPGLCTGIVFAQTLELTIYVLLIVSLVIHC
jgi:hypothetical protein